MRVAVQFVASSNMGPAIADINKVNARLAALAAQMKAIPANPGAARELRYLQDSYLQNVNRMQAFETQSVKTRTVTQRLTDDIIKQRIAMKDLSVIRKRATLDALAEQQMRLQQSSAMITGRSPDGRVQGHLIQPTNALGSAAQKAAVRQGILGQAMMSAGQQAIKTGKNMQWSGRQLQNGFTVPLLLAAGAAGKFAYDMDKAMVRLTKVYGDTAGASERELQRVREATTQTAKDVARDFGIAGKETVELAADFAAAGQQGEDLQTATYQTSRIAMLGELERQQAMKATIAVQTVFGISADQLADKFNFLNAVENQTNTTLQDLVEAIPRVAGTIKSLGGTLEDSAIFTVAFKEAGITAAQGANALRSSLGAIVAPSMVARKVLKNMGVDIEEIVNKNAGNLMGTLKGLGAALEGMSGPERQKALATLFGRYQFNKMDQLIIGLTQNADNMNSQVGRAFSLAGASVEELAAVADREEKEIRESLSGRLMRTLRTIQLEMADFGRPLLSFFTTLMEGIGFVVKALNMLPGPLKLVIALLATGFLLAGPLLRLRGLFIQLYGQVFRFAGALLTGKTGFKQMLTSSGMFAHHAQKSVIPTLQSETQAFNLLAVQIERTGRAIATLAVGQRLGNMAGGAAAAAAATGATRAGLSGPAPVGSFAIAGTRQVPTAATAQPRIPKGQPGAGQFATRPAAAPPIPMPIMPVGIGRDPAGRTSPGTALPKNTAEAARNAARLKDSLEESRHRMNAIAGSAAGAAGMMAIMVGQGNKWVTGLGMGLIALSLYPPLLVKIASGLKAVAVASGLTGLFGRGAGRAGIGAMGTMIKSLGAAALAASGPLLAIAGTIFAVIGAVKLYNREVKKTEERQRALSNSARSMANTIGFSYKTAGQTIIDKNGEVVKSIAEQTEEWKKSSKEAELIAEHLRGIKSEERIVEEATAIGVRARVNGADADQAVRAVQIALQAAGRPDLFVNVKMDFENERAVAEREVELRAEELKNIFNNKFHQGRMEGFGRLFKNKQNSTNLNRGAETAAVEAGKAFAEKLNNTNKQEVKKAFVDLRASFVEGAESIYAGLEISGRQKSILQSLGVNPDDAKQVTEFFGQFTDDGQMGEEIGWDNQRALEGLAEQYYGVAQAQRKYMDGIVEARGLRKEDYQDVNSISELMARLGYDLIEVSAAQKQYDAEILRSMEHGRGLNAEQQLQILNAYRLKAGLAPATSVLQGFGDATAGATEKTAAFNREMSKRNVSVGDFMSAFKNNLTGNISSAMDLIMSQYDKSTEAYEKTLDTQDEMWQDSLDTRKQASDDEFEERKRKLDAGFDTEAKKLDDRHEDEMSRAESLKEEAIKAVNDQLDAADKLDQKRQDMFDAEITRIKRLADAANRNIDFNVAIRSGDMDEAARVFEAGYVEDVTNNMTDATAGDATVADTRKAAGEERIERITKTHDGRIDRLKDRQEDEKRAFETSKDLRRQQLEDEKQIADQRFDNEKKLHDKNLQVTKQRYAAERAEMRKTIDEELRKRAENVPVTVEMYQKMFDDFGVMYKNNTGVALTQTKEWTRLQMTGFDNAFQHTREQLSNQAVWNTIGEQSIDGLTKGMLGMSFAEFSEWMATGKLPATNTPASNSSPTPVSPANKPGGSVYNSQVPAQARHGGGPIGPDKFNNRAGRPANAPLRAGEVPIIAQTGEFVVKRDAVDRVGMNTLHAINQGKLGPDKTGRMHEGGLVGTVGAGIMGVFQKAMETSILAGAQRKSKELAAQGDITNIPMAFADQFGQGYTPGEAGKYGGTIFDAEQLTNAAAIVSTGRSMGASDRDLLIGLMTAMQESSLRNINYGDQAGPDSRGLFQQRDSWGPLAIRMNPNGAARLFFQQLLALKGREELPMTLAANKVQRSAHPEAYAKWEDEARAILSGGVIAGQPIGAEALGTGTIGGTGGRGVDSTGDLIALLQKSGLPFRISSRYRPGARTHASGNLSYHATNNAIDVAGPRPGVDTPEMLAINRYFAKFGRGLKELIYSGPGAINLNNGRPHQYSGVTAADHHDHVHVAATKDSLKSLEIPGLKVGGTVMYDNTLANLHKGEKVLTAPLSQKLEQGISNMDNSSQNVYNIEVHGAPGQSVTELARAVRVEMEKTQVRQGLNRRIN